MLILNLANPEKSTIPFEVVDFSDSQKLVNLLGRYAQGVTNVEPSVMIVSRMSWNDLQLIICANQALLEVGFKEIHLFVPYFLGARSDRKFVDGGINYLKKVICPLINSQNFKSVQVLDPHSHCLEMGLNNLHIETNSGFVGRSLEYLKLDNKQVKEEEYVWLIPDKGAVDKAYNAIKHIKFTGNVVECTKKRDIKTGKIVETNIPSEVIFENDPCIIVDDICDGGYTFIELAKVAKKRGAGKMYLLVTHGIFSQGFEELSKYFDGIYCTNSFKKGIPPRVKRDDYDEMTIHPINVF